MHDRMTWNPADPAPYESAWSVFVKLMALNYCKPRDIAELIRRNGSRTSRKLEFRDSTWIDFERFGALLDIEPDRLRTGFLDQLGFPQFTYYDGPHGIRFCPDCLRRGYHCTLFDLALIAECPIHGKPLEKGCAGCYTTVASSGLECSPIPCKIPGGVIHDSAWRADSYSSKCGHVHFDPEAVTGISRFDFDEQREVREACEAFIRWWQSIFSGPSALPALVARLARQSFGDRGDDSLGFSLDIARTIGGTCPWSTSIAPSPANWLTCRRQDATPDAGDGNIEFDSGLGRIYRAIRRHIFEKHVRPSHLSCWREMLAYEHWMSRAIGSRNVCTTVMAYMSWRMSIEGFSNIEAFRIAGNVTSHIRFFDTPTHTVAEIANLWYAQFFAILGRIEQLVQAGGHFYIERSSRVVWFRGYYVFMPDERVSTGHSSRGASWVAYPNKEHVLQNATARCFARPRKSETMLNVTSVDQLRGWEWTGILSEFAKPGLLFRVKDDATAYSRSRHYTYLSL